MINRAMIAGLLGLCLVAFNLRPAEAQSNHPGLLGKRYIDTQYMYGRALTDSAAFDFDDMSGKMFSINLPMSWFARLGFQVDLNAMYMSTETDGIARGALDAVTEDITGSTVMANVWFDRLGRIRPFASVGVDFLKSKLKRAGTESRTSETNSVLRAGLELDLSRQIALRGAVDIETKDTAGETSILGEVIFRPNNSFFVRLGAIAPIEGDGLVGILGGGIDF
jgi:hypothetical protein